MATVTQDIAGALLFNDGEPIEPGDLNDMQSLTRRLLGDDLARDRIFFGNEGALRTLGNGLELLVAGSAITITGGAFMYRLTADPGEPDYRYLSVRSGTETGLTIPLNSLGFTRWDIISVKVEQVAGTSIVRDFKDATTGALSTLAVNKRRNLRVTFEQTLGTVAATEPAVPAGFTKIARIQVLNGLATATMADVRDFRVPAGYSRFTVMPQDAYGEGNWAFLAGDAATWSNSGVVAGQALHIPVTPSDQRFFRDVNISNARLASVHFSGLLGPTGQLLVRRKSNEFGVAGATLLDISSILTLGVGGTYHKDMAAEEPVWSNGRSAPNQIASDPDDMASVVLKALSGNTAADVLSGVAVEFWGSL